MPVFTGPRCNITHRTWLSHASNTLYNTLYNTLHNTLYNTLHSTLHSILYSTLHGILHSITFTGCKGFTRPYWIQVTASQSQLSRFSLLYAISLIVSWTLLSSLSRPLDPSVELLLVADPGYLEGDSANHPVQPVDFLLHASSTVDSSTVVQWYTTVQYSNTLHSTLYSTLYYTQHTVHSTRYPAQILFDPYICVSMSISQSISASPSYDWHED